MYRQLIQVAERRFRDAEALCATGENERAIGVQYLAGFTIEILLKVNLVEKFSFAAREDRFDRLSPSERKVWFLVWRSHDLGGMIEHMPELEDALRKRGHRDGRRYAEDLKAIISTWSIFLRYSTATSNIREARMFLERVRNLKELMK